MDCNFHGGPLDGQVLPVTSSEGFLPRVYQSPPGICYRLINNEYYLAMHLTDVPNLVATDHYRAAKELYDDGVGCSVWLPFPDNEFSGVTFDFQFEHIDELIDLLNKLKYSSLVQDVRSTE